MAVGLVAMLIASSSAQLLGRLPDIVGWVDHVLMRLTDLFIALPPLPLLLLVVYLFREPCAGSSTLSWASFSSL